ncbi:MFS transporter [Marinobacterium zhoushanense]|uniref:MFS transporter n=1 Tax=Marinobacterium zhoushanense TaxID=1679163 RepID=A0ABQ1KJ89_9GAMM|nr:MFS transporter [Marinobacterium zhoushanense]GGC02000.1 MFS transporter [Marinobacterium zhoushanense]
MKRRESLTHNLYQKLINEEDARACKAIDEAACREVPGNFMLTLFSQFLTQLGDAVSNPKIVLPWIMESIAAPLYLLGLLVPIRESGSMLPQLVIASYVRRMPVRKTVWVVGSVLQALATLGIALVAWQLEGTVAGWSIIALLTLFSLSRGLCSVASKDVIGKTIPKKQRGRLSGWSSSAAGLITLSLGALLLINGGQAFSPEHYGLLLAGAGTLWLIAALVYMQVKEFPGETSGGVNGFTEALKRLDILRTDKPFRRFVITRALMLCSALTAPYYVVLAQQHLGSPTYLLGLFILASGTAGLLSGPFWGQFADVSSRQVLIVSALLTSLLGFAVFTVDRLAQEWLSIAWVLPLVYFILSVAHHGVRIGRKTYVIDLAEGNKRTDYVSVSNTVIGFILLLMGLIGALSGFLQLSGIILLLSCLCLGGAALALTLPETE